MATSANHGILDIIANKCSSGKLSETGIGSPSERSLDKKYATWLSLPGRSRIVILNYWISNNHLVILSFVISLFIKYLMV